MANCAKCGACCEAIFIKPSYETLMERSRAFQNPPEGYAERDPAHEEVWQQWDRYLTINVLDDLFMRDHWHPILNEDRSQFTIDNGNRPRYGYTCDAYDAKTRLCTMQAGKPPICADYPYYGNRQPNEPHKTPDRAQLRCSYWWDVPREEWPQGVDPLPSPPDE